MNSSNPPTPFGIELPYNVADPFATIPEQFFSLRRMPEAVRDRIPRTPQALDTWAQRVKELGAEFVVYDLRAEDPAAAERATAWAAGHGLGIYLNNPIPQLNGPYTPGRRMWTFPPDLLARARAHGNLRGVIHDELIIHQLNIPENAIADVSDASTARAALDRIEGGLAATFAPLAAAGHAPFLEEVVPTLFHATAKAGGYPGCKVMKEELTPVIVTLCMSAALQYRRPWLACVDLWEGDCGPWYQIMGYHSGHSPVEYLNALTLTALLAPDVALSESADVLWEADSPAGALTEFGEVHRRFMRDIRPSLPRAFDLRTWRPTIAIVRSEDGCFTRGAKADDSLDSKRCPRAPWVVNQLGCPQLVPGPAEWAWLKLWYHLTWGRCWPDSLWHPFEKHALEASRRHQTGGNEYDFGGVPPLAKRRDPTRPESHLHTLFAPLNNVAVFDGADVTPDQLASAELVVLCGSYPTPHAVAVAREAVRRGAHCLCQTACATPEVAGLRGERIGSGRWWTVDDFDDDDAMDQLLRWRGHHNQWVLTSGAGTLRMFSTDPWGNEIDFRLETP